MTELERRQVLDLLGFEVMSLPYEGGLFYMRRLQPDRSWNHRQRDGRQYSINLDTGRWVCWGVGRWHDWEELPGARSGASFDAGEPALDAGPAPPDDAAPAGEHSWVTQCRRVGFEIAPGGLSAFGNVFARFRGERFLITTVPPGIVDSRFGERRLEEFGGSSTPPPVESAPLPRATLQSIVFDDRPVVTSGRNRQTSLFS